MSCAIDPKAGTHFVGKIFVSPHACDRATEHFGVERSKAAVFVMDMLRKASLVDPDVIDDNGNSGRMFAYNRTVFIVASTEATVITIHPQHQASEVIRTPIERIIQRAIKTAQNKEKRESKRINIRKAELAIDRANCELRLAKSESVRVIADMTDKIAEIDLEVKRLDRELFELRREKKTLMKSVAAYV